MTIFRLMILLSSTWPTD